MPGHNLQHQLENVKFDSDLSAFQTPEGRTFGYGKTVGNGIEGWAPNALFVHTDGGQNARVYINVGTSTTAVFRRYDSYATSGDYFSFSSGTYALFSDNAYVSLGSGNDVNLLYNGTYLEAGPSSGMWADCPLMGCTPNTTSCYEVYDDFTEYDSTATVGNWAALAVGTGAPALGTTAAGGELVLTCQATTDNACQQIHYVSTPFKLAAGKTLWYETRLKQTGDVQSEVSFGLCSAAENLTAVADVYPEDGVCLAHQDGSMALALTCSKSGTNTGAVAGVHTMVTGTYATYGLKVSGVTSVTPYVNGTAGTAATATICDDLTLQPYFLVRNGDATTQQILTIDYVRVVQLR